MNHLSDVDFQKVHKILNLTHIYVFLIGQVQKKLWTSEIWRFSWFFWHFLKSSFWSHWLSFSKVQYYRGDLICWEITVVTTGISQQIKYPGTNLPGSKVISRASGAAVIPKRTVYKIVILGDKSGDITK